jgi:hypothetical protein
VDGKPDTPSVMPPAAPRARARWHVYALITPEFGSTLCGAVPERSVLITEAWRIADHPDACPACVARWHQQRIGCCL